MLIYTDLICLNHITCNCEDRLNFVFSYLPDEMANRWIVLINTLFANIRKGDTKQEQCDESVAHCIAISTFFKNATLLPACHDTVTSRGFG